MPRLSPMATAESRTAVAMPRLNIAIRARYRTEPQAARSVGPCASERAAKPCAAVNPLPGRMSRPASRDAVTATAPATSTSAPTMAALAAIVGALVLVAGAVAVTASLLAGRLILPGNGFTAAHGFAALSLAHGPTLRAACGSVLYLALIAMFSLGIATAVRDSAVAIGLSLGMLYLPPILIALTVTNPVWLHRLQRYTPMTAGLTIQNTTGLHGLPITPWAGLGVLALWAAAALLTGGLLLKVRDA